MKLKHRTVKSVEKMSAYRVCLSPEDTDDLQNGCNYEASGEGVLVVDTDQLDNATSKVAGKVLKALPKDFTGLVYIVCD